MALTQITKDFITRSGIVVQGTAAVTTSSGSSGALQVNGGASINKNLVVGTTATVWGDATLKSTLGVDGAVTINDATAGSTSTGALKLTAGGASIAGAMYINDTTAVATGTGALVVAGGQHLGGDLFIDGSTAGSTGAGALRVNNGGAWVSGDVHVGGTTAGGAGAGALVVGGGGGYFHGDLYVNGGSAASASAGALRVSAGGLSVAGAGWINSTATAVTAGGGDGALRVAGGAYVGDNLIVASTAWDTSTNTANALYVAGGAWIDKTLFVDGDVTFNKNFTVNGTATYVYSTVTMLTDNILELHNSPTGAWTVDDGKDVGTVFNYFKGSAKQAFLGWDNSSTYLEWWEEGSEDPTGNFVGTVWGTFKTGQLKLTSTTAATNTSTGALTVEGGVGIGGDLWVQGTANFGSGLTGTITTATNLEGGGAGYIPIQNAAGQTSFIAAGTADNQVLTWNNAGTTATWQSAGATVVGAATTASNLAGGDVGYIPFQSATSSTTFDSEFKYDDTTNTLNLLNVNSTGTIDAVNIDVNAGAVTLDGSSSLTLNQLSTNKVAFVNGSNVLSTDAELTYDDTIDTLGVVNVNVNTGTVTMSAGSTLQLNQLDYNSVPFVSATGALNTDGAAFAYDPATDTLDVVNVDVNAGTMTFDSSSTLKLNQLSTGKVPYINASNNIATDADLSYDDATDTLSVVNLDIVNGSIDVDSSSTVTLNQLSTNKVAFINSANVLSTDAQLGYDDTTDTLDVVNVNVNAGTMTFDSSSTITVNQLTVNKVAFVNASNVLSTDAELSYDGTTDTLGVVNVDVNAGTVTFDSSSTLQLNQLTTNSVAFVGNTGALETDAGFTYDATADLLTVANFTATNQLWVANTATVDGDLYVNGDIFLKGAGLNTISAATGTFDFVVIEGTGTGLTVVDGAVVQGTTQATSTGTGAFQVTGGAAVGGNVHVGGDLYVTGTAYLASINLDSAFIYDTLTVESTATLNGPVFATTATQADGHGQNTGAVQLTGGLLVKKNIVAGGLVIGGDFNGGAVPTNPEAVTVDAFYSNNFMHSSFTKTGISGSSNVNLDTFDKTLYTTAKYLVQVKDGSDIHSAEILLIHDGTDAYTTEYGIITTAGELGVFDAAVSGGNVQLKFTPTSATAMTIQVVRLAVLTAKATYAV